jgi:hypothetical protein
MQKIVRVVLAAVVAAGGLSVVTPANAVNLDGGGCTFIATGSTQGQTDSHQCAAAMPRLKYRTPGGSVGYELAQFKKGISVTLPVLSPLVVEQKQAMASNGTSRSPWRIY